MVGKARLLLVEVHRDDAEVDRRPLAQARSRLSSVKGILAARHADHHHVAPSIMP